MSRHDIPRRHSATRTSAIFVAATLVSAVCLTVVGSAHGAELKVRPTAEDCKPAPEDGVYCSLGEAVARTNEAAGPDVIVLEEGGLYVLSEIDHQNEGGNGLPAITDTLTIEGHGAIIERSRDFKAPVFRLFRVAETGNLTLREVTLRNGATPRGFDGAGIWSVGSLTVERSVLEDNHSGDDGGALRNDGELRISDSLIRGNTARWRGGVGGGLQNPEQFGKARAVVERTTFVDNEAWATGGAAWLEGEVLFENVTVSGNRAGKRGGGIESYGELELRNCTIVDNRAHTDGGGLHAFRPVTIGNTILVHNEAMISADCDAKLISRGHNLFGKLYRCVIEGEAGGEVEGDQIVSDSGLASLAEVDGAWVHVPSAGGSAVDRGNPAAPGSSEAACAKLDQRGRERGKTRCDVGAVESGP